MFKGLTLRLTRNRRNEGVGKNMISMSTILEALHFDLSSCGQKKRLKVEKYPAVQTPACINIILKYYP